MKIQNQIENMVREAFDPEHLELVNESHMHSVPANSETHFKLVLVTPEFEGLRLVQRHQMVFKAVASLMNNPVHALAMHTFSPAEWSQRTGVADSPNCLGGAGK